MKAEPASTNAEAVSYTGQKKMEPTLVLSIVYTFHADTNYLDLFSKALQSNKTGDSGAVHVMYSAAKVFGSVYSGLNGVICLVLIKQVFFLGQIVKEQISF